MPITDWPYEDRPREKLLSKGEKTLTDAELIAIFLKTGTRGKTALALAQELLQEYGSLQKLLRTPAHILIKKPGMGKAKYATLIAALELGRRHLHQKIMTKEKLNNSHLTRDYLKHCLGEYHNEVFACLFMDTHFRLIHYEELFHGTIHSAAVYPREIVRRGLLHNAAKIILAHNHPSGHPEPSSADRQITLLIKQALELVDIEVVDHIIIGNPETFSFADAGMI